MTTDRRTPSCSRRKFLSLAVASAAVAGVRPLFAAQNSAARDPLLLSQNPVIVRARESGLEVLKPTPAELEAGLTLHRQSLVFDAYGFAPRAALDAPRMTAAIEAGASDVEMQDLREDLSMTQATVDPAEHAEFVEAMQCSGVTAIFQNAGEEGQDPLRLMKRLARFTYLTDRMRGVLMRATVPADIETAQRAGQHCLYLTGNGVPLPATWISVEEELGYVRLFYQLGVRMMHVTYNRRNLLGDGCAETANGGLSDFGRAAIAEMNRVGVIVDVAHSGWKTSLEAAQTSQKPMVASHTVCAGLRDHIRAKPDEVIKAICDTGGLIGICWIPTFLGGSGDIAALLDHIDYAVKRFGVDHVAIGTDVAHSSQHAGKANQAIPKQPHYRRRYEALWPDGALGGHWPRSASLGWTNWPLVTVGLVQRGYKEEEIRKILGQNMLRVCRAQTNAELTNE
ncbi:dipeptidase [Blastopirellula sp. JC732]|uniref:Dipeptidase n=1 Tax=Blastopirellula sediminis TaxID=2894196 RepID=A0A9X1MM12_9BACT|nr:membrane dipeptidase [Blastopirellula sediminis]MCC9607154.1 dipeptidase [Blastopirellula sediminis]MCC9629553.1 dipeptidase [Blastopirellula sediminis]